MMRPMSHTLIESVAASVVQLFALLTDPLRIPEWMPGCDSVHCQTPLRKGARFTARFGRRETEFEVVDFAPPATFGWVERGQRHGWKTFFRLDTTPLATAVTIRTVWIPRSFGASLRARFFEKRSARQQLTMILANLRRILAPDAAPVGHAEDNHATG